VVNRFQLKVTVGFMASLTVAGPLATRIQANRF
jgi:hypothetical protein